MGKAVNGMYLDFSIIYFPFDYFVPKILAIFDGGGVGGGGGW